MMCAVCCVHPYPYVLHHTHFCRFDMWMMKFGVSGAFISDYYRNYPLPLFLGELPGIDGVVLSLNKKNVTSRHVSIIYRLN